MPTIDVTPALINGLNAASGMLGGYTQTFLAGQALQQRTQALEDEQAYRNHLLKLRSQEMARSSEFAAQEMRLKEREVALRENTFDFEKKRLEDERSSYSAAYDYASGFEGALGGKNVEDLEKRLSEQRSNVNRFLSTLSPDAQRVARAVLMPALADDERRERDTMARKGAGDLWRQLASNPALAEITDSEGKAIPDLAAEKIAALEAGADSVSASMSDYDQIRKLLAQNVQKARDLQDATDWAMKQIAEGNQGGADTTAMNSELADWLTQPDSMRDVKDLKRRILSARHGIEMDTYKIGDVEVPRSLKPTTAEWAEIAESEANREVAKLLSTDPWVKKAIDDGELSKQEYMDWREQHRRSILRGYGARAGLTMEQMRTRGWVTDSEVKRVEDAARNRIAEALRAAGIDPELKVKAPARLGSPENPMLQGAERFMDTPETPPGDEDNTYDEDDIERTYGREPR